MKVRDIQLLAAQAAGGEMVITALRSRLQYTGVEVTGWRYIDQSNILELKINGEEIPAVLRTDRILEVGPYRLLMAFSNEPIPCE